jgi:beta-phosphoglucomutase-like phosphatase (HAD superfamily)
VAPFNAVVFDMDGVVIDTAGVAAANTVYRWLIGHTPFVIESTTT